MITRFLIWFKDKIRGVPLGGIARSSDWPRVRAEHLKNFPNCAVCNGTKKCECHHILPFHTNPSLELLKSNLITLCRKNDCHLRFGHLYSYLSFNTNIREDAEVWKLKITNRP